MRTGMSLGSDVWQLYRSRVTRQDCARHCDSSSACTAFMHYDNRKCFINLRNTLSILYERVPNGYAMRPGNIPENDFADVDIHESLTECAERCSNIPSCLSFKQDGRECSLKTRTCADPIIKDPNDLFYDKIPTGYFMRPGDCPGNDIWFIYARSTSLEERARRCGSHPTCISFMFFNGHECYPKSKTCSTTSKSNPNNFFYDKIKVII